MMDLIERLKAEVAEAQRGAERQRASVATLKEQLKQVRHFFPHHSQMVLLSKRGRWLVVIGSRLSCAPTATCLCWLSQQMSQLARMRTSPPHTHIALSHAQVLVAKDDLERELAQEKQFNGELNSIVNQLKRG